MSAELLRRAATILRERAEAVDNREDWREFYEDSEFVMHPAAGRDDAQFIALMSPGFGLELAKWLDDIAAGWIWDEDGEGGFWDDGMPLRLEEAMDSHAIAVARLIVGGQ